MLFILAILNKHKSFHAQRASADPLIYTQRLDHFRFNKDYTTTWDQRYYVNDDFYKVDTDTMIVEISGEWELTSAPGGTAENPDIFGEVAKQHNAKIFALEHRYYGESKPTDDTTENLRKYHNSRQALADMMQFIDQQDESLCQTVRVDGKMCFKWIIFGGSYPGALAGWIAQKFPFAFAATISSSGVVNAIHSLPEFDQQTYRSSGAVCAKAQLLAMREIEEAMELGDEWPRTFMGIEKDDFWNVQDFYWFVADAGL